MAADEMGDDEARIDFPEYPPLDESGTVDLWQIEANLALTPAQRIRQFENFMELARAMREAGKKHYGELPAADPKAP
jgi:hypothetical protein